MRYFNLNIKGRIQTHVAKYNKLSKQINNSKKTKTITNSTLSNWENNVYQPDPDSISILCNIFNINANELLEIDKIENDYYSKNVTLNDGNSLGIYHSRALPLFFYLGKCRKLIHKPQGIA